MAFYLILKWPQLEFECSNAYEMLLMAWKMDIRNAKYICVNRLKKLLIFSYNPCASDSPNSWKIVKTYRVKNNHP